MSTDTQKLRQHIQQLDSLLEAGVLAPETHRDARAALERNLAMLVLSDSTPAGKAADASTAPPAAAAIASTAVARSASAAAARPRAARAPARRLWLGTAVLVLGVGGAGTWWVAATGAHGSANAALAPMPSAPSTQAPHAMGNDQLEAMVQKLADRLKKHPADPEGWAMLARSYANMGRHKDAAAAYVKALALRKNDAVLMADYADELAVLQGRRLAGEPMVWVKRALALQPDQPKALLLAATDAIDRQDSAQAVKLWTRVLKNAPPGSAVAMQAQAGLDEVRGTGQGSVLPPSAPAVVAGLSGATMGAAPGAARIEGTVSLDPKLAGRTQPTDTVFIYARPAQGSRMPLAMLQRQAKDFPVHFELDDSSAMSPQSRLSSAREVVVAVRVSRSGQAMPQPGDLEGVSGPVAVGTRDLKLQVARVVQ